jgi:hypothetical protein
MCKQIDMIGKKNGHDLVGKLIWQHVDMTTQCNQLAK